VLARDENKQWQVRALKQKLLVDTVNYEIQVRPPTDSVINLHCGQQFC